MRTIFKDEKVALFDKPISQPLVQRESKVANNQHAEQVWGNASGHITHVDFQARIHAVEVQYHPLLSERGGDGRAQVRRHEHSVALGTGPQTRRTHRKAKASPRRRDCYGVTASHGSCVAAQGFSTEPHLSTYIAR
jgi:hypothetical protein